MMDDRDRWPLDGSDGPAQPISAEHADRLVKAALARSRTVVIKPRRRYWTVALAAALALILGSALAALLPRKTSKELPPVSPAPGVVAPAQPVESVTAATGEPPPETSPEPSAVVAPPVVAQEPPPADLLRRANHQRSERKWSDAEATYERVLSRSPQAEEGYVATVAAASIRLEHLGDAAWALRLYRSAVAQRPNGSLAEEARWGVAEAERALGDRAGEIDALRAFIAAHPNGVMRPSADQRLGELAP